MTRESPQKFDSPIDGAPVWLRALQAGAVGVAAGLALHLLLSLVVVQGKDLAQPTPPATCRKSNPARESGGPGQRGTPSVSIVPAAAIPRG